MFNTTLSCMAFLFVMIFAGWGLAKLKILPESTAVVLSRLETYLFIPALVLNSFLNNFTVESLSEMGVSFLAGVVFCLFSIILALTVPKILTKEKDLQKLFAYGIAFSNFGFVGNSVITQVIPTLFSHYVIFTLPLWIGINLWGAPMLLTDKKVEHKSGFWVKVKSVINPFMVAMFIGMVIGLSGIKIPYFLSSSIKTVGDCMSPVAMLLTGITVAESKFSRLFSKVLIYVASAIRLILIPAVTLLIIYLFKIPASIAYLLTCASCMPLGLNVVVIPKSFGKDVSDGNSMVLISHLFAILTVPLVFYILTLIV